MSQKVIMLMNQKLNEVNVMVCVVVDVDDTLTSTTRRMKGVWRQVLSREVPLEAVETFGLEQIFMKFASAEQKAHVREFQKRFWDVVLCLDEGGVGLMGLHEAVPFAADVLQKWSKECRLVYLTGRTENMRELTLAELKRFGFPVDGIELLMFSVEDYGRARGVDPSGITLIEAKRRLFASLAEQYNVVRVIDDYPGYFPIFKQFGVPDRVGLLLLKRYKPQQYIERGATRVVDSWKELKDDFPKSV
ncbi:MAG: HAD family acid phosphatase [Candidatus Bathyarchaeota archaeon]|nr:HAD family acid phosphatase [Candidatus Bathyarchaeota archaeon]